MRWSRVAITLLVLASLVVAVDAQQANYAGAAKIVLQITGMGFDQGSKYFHTQVLYSSDPAIKTGQNYDLYILQQMDGYFGETFMAPGELFSGTIIGINDYYVDGTKITVGTSADPKDDKAWNNAWKQKITILNGNSDSNSLQTNPGSLFSTSSSLFSSMPSIGPGNSLLNTPFANSPTDNKGLTTQSQISGKSSTYGLNNPFDLFSSGLNAFPSFGSGTQLFSMGGLI